MGIGYTRAKKIQKKECEICHSVWDDDQIYDDSYIKHGYGGDECPFCHRPWELTTIRKLPKLRKKRDDS
jgi:hypothetical protein